MKTELIATNYATRKLELIIHHRETPDAIGTFALALIEKWGLVAAKPGGEDAAGRAKLDPLSPEEVVARACDTAERAYAALRERGLMIDMPSWEQLREQARIEDARN